MRVEAQPERNGFLIFDEHDLEGHDPVREAVLQSHNLLFTTPLWGTELNLGIEYKDQQSYQASLEKLIKMKVLPTAREYEKELNRIIREAGYGPVLDSLQVGSAIIVSSLLINYMKSVSFLDMCLSPLTIGTASTFLLLKSVYHKIKSNLEIKNLKEKTPISYLLELKSPYR